LCDAIRRRVSGLVNNRCQHWEPQILVCLCSITRKRRVTMRKTRTIISLLDRRREKILNLYGRRESPQYVFRKTSHAVTLARRRPMTNQQTKSPWRVGFSNKLGNSKWTSSRPSPVKYSDYQQLPITELLLCSKVLYDQGKNAQRNNAFLNSRLSTGFIYWSTDWTTAPFIRCPIRSAYIFTDQLAPFVLRPSRQLAGRYRTNLTP